MRTGAKSSWRLQRRLIACLNICNASWAQASMSRRITQAQGQPKSLSPKLQVTAWFPSRLATWTLSVKIFFAITVTRPRRCTYSPTCVPDLRRLSWGGCVTVCSVTMLPQAYPKIVLPHLVLSTGQLRQATRRLLHVLRRLTWAAAVLRRLHVLH